MSSYSPFDRVVSNMFSKFSGTATVQIQGEGVYDPTTSTFVTTDAEFQVKIMVFDYQQKGDGFNEMKGTRVDSSDRQVLIKPFEKDGQPKMPRLQPNKDKIVIDGTSYKIMSVKELNPSMTDNVITELYVHE